MTKQIVNNINRIKDLCVSLGVVSVYDISKYSLQELYYMLAQKVNEIIKELSRFENIIADEIIEQNKLLEQLLNGGLSDEVVKQLEKWLNDGTIENIINHEIFDKLNKNVNKLIENNNDFLLYSFFRNNSSSLVDFYISNDGDTLKRINSISNISGRDTSIIYKNGWWLMASTSYNPHDFKIIRSKNFVDWEEVYINCGLFTYTIDDCKVWAPEFFEDDNGDLYVILSKKIGMTTDRDNKTIPNFRPYITKCLDVETLTFENARELLLEDKNKIDGCMIKHNNTYNLFIKDEYDKYTEHWTSKNMIQWKKKKERIEELGCYVEGATITKYKDLFYLYVDSFLGDNGLIYYSTSSDLETWSERRLVKVGTNRVRHGCVYNVKDEKAKLDIQKYSFANIGIPHHNVRAKGFTLSQFADENNEIHNLEIVDKAVYSITNLEHFTIKSFKNNSGAKSFYLYISTNSEGSITIDTNGDVVGVPANYKYSAEFGDNDVMIEFLFIESIGKFKPTTISNTFLANKNPLKKGGWKTVTLTSQTISNLDVEDGVVYRVNGGQDVVINGIADGKRSATHFYLMLATGGSGSITVNSGNNLTVPGGTYVMTKENGLNDCLIEFIKVDGSTFRLRK